MIGLIGLIVLGNGNIVGDPPRYRHPAFFLWESDESRQQPVVRTTTTSLEHAVRLSFHRPDSLTGGDNVTQIVSIRNHHGFIAETDGVHADFDTGAGTPPEGTSSDWIHFDTGEETAFPSPLTVFYCRPTGQSTELPGGYMWIVVREDADVGEPPVRKRAIYHLRIDLRKRIATGDGPIDTRLVYGEPNDDGWYANANGMLRYVNFNPWIYKGGLFVGNMPVATGDGSGKARSQFWFADLDEDDEEHLQFMNFSVAHMGPPKFSDTSLPTELKHQGEVSIGLWAGVEQQGHTGVTESTATWENRWVLSGDPWPPEAGSSPAGVELPVWTEDSEDYLNFPLTLVDNFEEGLGSMTHKDNAFTRLFLALVDEAAFTNARWRYFVSKESGVHAWKFGPEATSLDLKPRQWAAVLGYGEYTESTLTSLRGKR